MKGIPLVIAIVIGLKTINITLHAVSTATRISASSWILKASAPTVRSAHLRMV
jgi:hypothetical protein